MLIIHHAYTHTSCGNRLRDSQHLPASRSEGHSSEPTSLPEPPVYPVCVRVGGPSLSLGPAGWDTPTAQSCRQGRTGQARAAGAGPAQSGCGTELITPSVLELRADMFEKRDNEVEILTRELELIQIPVEITEWKPQRNQESGGSAKHRPCPAVDGSASYETGQRKHPDRHTGRDGHGEHRRRREETERDKPVPEQVPVETIKPQVHITKTNTGKPRPRTRVSQAGEA